MDAAGRLTVQLAALTHSPQGHVDDTRFEKLLDRLAPYVSEASKIQLFISTGGLEAIEKGLALDDARVVSVAIRLVGILIANAPSSTPSNLLDSLLAVDNIAISADALIRHACLIGLSTAAHSNSALDWMTAPERCNRLVSFMFRSFSDSSVFVARAASQLLCELIIKGPQTEQRLIEAGLKRHIEISMSEVPLPENVHLLTSPPPLHHNKICLIDLAISFYQRTSKSNVDISLTSLLGLLMDPDRHVRSRMVEAVQLIGLENSEKELSETKLYDVTNKLMSSGEGDLILTAIELVGVLRGVSEESIRKYFELVMGVVVPVFGKVIYVNPDDAPKTLPVKVSLPQNTLLQSVLECFKNLIDSGYTKVVSGDIVINLVIYGLSGGESRNMAYVRECHPAYELAALLLSRSHALIHDATWMSHHDTQRLLHALLAALARSWSAFSVKTVVSLLGNGKMEGRIFKEFGQQLNESIVKGFSSDESEPREHVVAFIGTLYKEDVSQIAVEYYIASSLYKLVVTALEDADSAVRTAALESLKFLCAEPQTWQLLVEISPESIATLISDFVPPTTAATSKVAEPSFLKKTVHLLYDEDPYVQRASIALISSWTSSVHTRNALLFLIWDPSSGLLEGINHALHRSDWDAQVQSIQLLRSICLTLGMLSFLAIAGHSLVLDMIKNCEERISQKEACSTLIALRALMVDLPSLLAPPLLSSPHHPSPLTPSKIGNMEYFTKELQTFYAQVNALELDSMMQGLSDEHLYDEDEEEDLVLRYQDIKADDDLDCD